MNDQMLSLEQQLQFVEKIRDKVKGTDMEPIWERLYLLLPKITSLNESEKEAINTTIKKLVEKIENFKILSQQRLEQNNKDQQQFKIPQIPDNNESSQSSTTSDSIPKSRKVKILKRWRRAGSEYPHVVMSPRRDHIPILRIRLSEIYNVKRQKEEKRKKKSKKEKEAMRNERNENNVQLTVDLSSENGKDLPVNEHVNENIVQNINDNYLPADANKNVDPLEKKSEIANKSEIENLKSTSESVLRKCSVIVEKINESALNEIEKATNDEFIPIEKSKSLKNANQDYQVIVIHDDDSDDNDAIDNTSCNSDACTFNDSVQEKSSKESSPIELNNSSNQQDVTISNTNDLSQRYLTSDAIIASNLKLPSGISIKNSPKKFTPTKIVGIIQATNAPEVMSSSSLAMTKSTIPTRTSSVLDLQKKETIIPQSKPDNSNGTTSVQKGILISILTIGQREEPKNTTQTTPSDRPTTRSSSSLNNSKKEPAVSMSPSNLSNKNSKSSKKLQSEKQSADESKINGMIQPLKTQNHTSPKQTQKKANKSTEKSSPLYARQSSVLDTPGIDVVNNSSPLKTTKSLTSAQSEQSKKLSVPNVSVNSFRPQTRRSSILYISQNESQVPNTCPIIENRTSKSHLTQPSHGNFETNQSTESSIIQNNISLDTSSKIVSQFPKKMVARIVTRRESVLNVSRSRVEVKLPKKSTKVSQKTKDKKVSNDELASKNSKNLSIEQTNAIKEKPSKGKKRALDTWEAQNSIVSSKRQLKMKSTNSLTANTISATSIEKNVDSALDNIKNAQNKRTEIGEQAMNSSFTSAETDVKEEIMVEVGPPSCMTPPMTEIPISAVFQNVPSDKRQLILLDPELTLKKIRPWLEKSEHRKFLKNCEEMLKNGYCLSALFKCMGSACSYFTNNSNLFLKHLYLHEKYQKKDIKNYSQCAYCNFIDDDCKKLMIHITNTHGNNKYQCAYCFYRSYDFHICSHQNLFHALKPKIIIECKPLSDLNESTELSEVWNNFFNICRPIICAFCKSKFYNIKHFENHYKSYEYVPSSRCLKCRYEINKETIIDHLKNCHNIGNFNCAFCTYTSDCIDSITIHISNHHSNKPLLYFDRSVQLPNFPQTSLKNQKELRKLIILKQIILSKLTTISNVRIYNNEKELENANNINTGLLE